ncbi:MAG: tRNA-dihydrouridine synthase 3 [Watsoniomyces obsoletus]|nr:MAG: tRNA-dihydrouridine synthase 3 [Watsoniomyces obsoletus]
MLSTTSRAALRRSRCPLQQRRTTARYSSTTSQATQAATEGASRASDAASTAASKASQGLSRVTSSAGPAITGAAQSAANALRRIGGRTGRLVSFVDSMIPPTLYYSRVGFELAKLVFRGQNMSPPPLSTFQSYLQPVLNAMRHPRDILSSSSIFNPIHLLHRIRSMSSQEMAAAAVVTAELLGFFTVGEILGKFKLVGYRGEKGDHH